MKKKHRFTESSGKKDKSILVPQREKVTFDLNIRERDDLTEKQKELNSLILDKKTQVVFINGPAGTSKTFCAIYCGLKLMQEHRISDLVYVRTIIESASKSLGSLPGEMGLKMEPFLMPLMDKMEEFLPSDQIKKLIGKRKNMYFFEVFTARHVVFEKNEELPCQ